MVDEFLNTLTETNKTHDFFVQWDKARKNQERFRDELALLQVLTHEDIDPETELTRLISNYPKINALIPLLAAVRVKPKGGISTLVVLDKDTAKNEVYNFGQNNLTSQDIANTVRFAVRTGLLHELTTINNHADYYFGVEVGLDTNARKNRSGSAMELLVEEYIHDLVSRYGGKLMKQTTFKKAAEVFGVAVPPREDNKKGDFMILVNNQPINIEVNYFDDGGSKQEIINSYIPRANDLREAGWGFALVTDGQGWLSNRRQLEEGYSRIGHIYNIHMCQSGLLNELIK
jgi:type II restriction enzyme